MPAPSEKSMMDGPGAEFQDDQNPYTASKSSLRRDRSDVVGGYPPPSGITFSVDHDLTDRDLRLYHECDLFRDPALVLGLFPRWVVVTTLMLAGVSFSFWVKFGSLLNAVGWGIIVSIGALIRLQGKMAGNKKEARNAGLCEGRRITISEDGLRVEIAGPPSEFVVGLGEMYQGWSTFRRVEFYEDYLILWRTGGWRLVIPLRAFGSPDQAEAFARAAAGWIGLAG